MTGIAYQVTGKSEKKKKKKRKEKKKRKKERGNTITSLLNNNPCRPSGQGCGQTIMNRVVHTVHNNDSHPVFLAKETNWKVKSQKKKIKKLKIKN